MSTYGDKIYTKQAIGHTYPGTRDGVADSAALADVENEMMDSSSSLALAPLNWWTGCWFLMKTKVGTERMLIAAAVSCVGVGMMMMMMMMMI
jgi:hypothetical protein